MTVFVLQKLQQSVSNGLQGVTTPPKLDSDSSDSHDRRVVMLIPPKKSFYKRCYIGHVQNDSLITKINSISFCCFKFRFLLVFYNTHISALRKTMKSGLLFTKLLFIGGVLLLYDWSEPHPFLCAEILSAIPSELHILTYKGCK